MSDGCSRCSGDDDGMPMVCFAVCGSAMSAILPSAPAVAPSAMATPTPLFVSGVAGHHGSPDPYPPKTASLG
jgi:hypothetical protein